MPLTRITVNLKPRANKALDELQNSGEGNVTDLVNEALILLAMVRRELNAGSDLVFRDTEGIDTVVRIL